MNEHLFPTETESIFHLEDESLQVKAEETNDIGTFPFLKVTNEEITLTMEAKELIREIGEEEVNIISIFGNENSGKSFLLNLILNIESDVYGAPWRKSSNIKPNQTYGDSKKSFKFINNTGNIYGKKINNYNVNSIAEVFPVSNIENKRKKNNEIIINAYPVKDGYKTTFFLDIVNFIKKTEIFDRKKSSIKKNSYEVLLTESEKKVFLIIFIISNVCIFNFNNNQQTQEMSKSSKSSRIHFSNLSSNQTKKTNTDISSYLKMASILDQLVKYFKSKEINIENTNTNFIVLLRDMGQETNFESMEKLKEFFDSKITQNSVLFNKQKNEELAINDNSSDNYTSDEENDIKNKVNDINYNYINKTKIDFLTLPYPFKSQAHDDFILPDSTKNIKHFNNSNSNNLNSSFSFNNNNNSHILSSLIMNNISNFNKETLSFRFTNKMNFLKEEVNQHYFNTGNYSSIAYKNKNLSGRKLNGILILEYFDLFLEQINEDNKLVPVEQIWIYILQRDLHLYHHRAISLFLEDLGLGGLVNNNFNTTVTNFNYNNTLVNNFISMQSRGYGMLNEGGKKLMSNIISNMKKDDYNNEENSNRNNQNEYLNNNIANNFNHKRDEENYKVHFDNNANYHIESKMLNSINNMNNLNNMNNMNNIDSSNKLFRKDIKNNSSSVRFKIDNEIIYLNNKNKQNSNINSNDNTENDQRDNNYNKKDHQYDSNTEIKEKKGSHFISLEEDPLFTEITDLTLIEEFVLIKKISKAKIKALEEYSNSINEHCLTHFTDYRELIDDSFKDLIHEMKRIENKLIKHNAKQISIANIKVLNSIFEGLKEKYKQIIVKRKKNGGMFNSVSDIAGYKEEDNNISKLSVFNSKTKIGKRYLSQSQSNMNMGYLKNNGYRGYNDINSNYNVSKEVVLIDEEEYFNIESIIELLGDYDKLAMGKSKIKDLYMFLFYYERNKKIETLFNLLFEREKEVTLKLSQMKDRIIQISIDYQVLSEYKNKKIEEIKFLQDKTNVMDFEKIRKREDILLLKEKIKQLKGERGFDTESNFNHIPNIFQIEDKRFENIFSEDKNESKQCTCDVNCIVY